jgi:small subunit ribosomal protein S8e
MTRTNTLTKSAIVQIDSTPFRQWYESSYGQAIAKGRGKAAKEAEAVVEAKKSSSVKRRQSEKLEKSGKLGQELSKQLEAGRIYAIITSRPGQHGRADGTILEGEELAFYLRAIRK